MAEDKAPETEIDVDSLDDKAFEEFKGKMRDEPAEPETKAAPEPDEPSETSEEKAARARDEQGRFVKAETTEDESGDDKPKSETVPHAKFHQANERRKAAEAEAAKAKQRLAELLELQQQPKDEPKPVEVPKFSQDPVKVGEWMQEQLTGITTQTAEQARARQEAEQTEAVYVQAEQVIAPILQAEAAEDPAIPEAYNYLRNSLGRELMRMGYSERDAVLQVNEMERQHVLYMATNGIDPGEYIKGWAGDRGWAPKAQQQEPTRTPAEQIGQREEIRKASLSLGKTGGGLTNTGQITPEQLLDMSDAEFEAYKKKHGSVAAAFMN